MSPITETFWVFDDDNYPCRCCSAVDAIEDGFWNCKERRWAIVEESFLDEHRAETCDGSCGNPFHGDFIRDLLCAELSGRGWGDVVMEWEDSEPHEVKAARRAAIAAELAEKARLAPLLAEHHAQVDRMRRCRATANEKKNKGRKEVAPCRSLYDYQRDGGCQTLHISTECWAHEFTDALTAEIVDEKTGRFLPMADQLHIRQAMTDKECGIFRKDGKYVLKWMPHVCYMSHPGEPTWNPKWKDNRLADREVRPSRADPRGGGGATVPRRDDTSVRNWRGGAVAVPSQPLPSPKSSNNRFAHLDSSW